MSRKLHWVLRIASAMCFIGHGAFGIITKKVWLNYFAVFGIGPDLGWQLMPLVGTFDILCGISLLLYPTRAVLSWLVIWGTTTALLRPLSGEFVAEFFERAGNFGAPLALLVIHGFDRRALFKRLRSRDIAFDEATIKRLTLCLHLVTATLLAGHGVLALDEKKGLLGQYASLGFANPQQIAHIIGSFEIAAAVGLLVVPARMRAIVIGLFVWKMASELLYPQWAIVEWIERGGSYGTLLALWMVLPAVRAPITTSETVPSVPDAGVSHSMRCAM
ncbi:MAG TPA: hypothetical protein VGC41_29705 [Kofleriaceae bacterium]